ncbi:hypothetical protein [Candidatus Magnetobacterium casense]|uniref:Uncharacterized protein n=1 Tax=Candidatus Magnetobacterium casense TaxID=1455061 RepID=A0ABS6S4V8_9BACT|nr:hypothetical protein [Candidatus Magnetobacterium casensis]MBV6343488.1 hypothetical protein [Candidatus Magnetobacterium casensis]
MANTRKKTATDRDKEHLDFLIRRQESLVSQMSQTPTLFFAALGLMFTVVTFANNSTFGAWEKVIITGFYLIIIIIVSILTSRHNNKIEKQLNDLDKMTRNAFKKCHPHKRYVSWDGKPE